MNKLKKKKIPTGTFQVKGWQVKKETKIQNRKKKIWGKCFSFSSRNV